MVKKLLFISILITVLVTGCSLNTTSENNHENSKPVILTTFYPVEEITKAIVKDTAEIEVLVGIGVEPHSFEPTPQQIVKFSKSDAFVTMEGMFEHVEEDIINANSNVKIIDAAHNLELVVGDDSHEHEEEEHDEMEIHDDHVEEEHEDEGHDDHDHGDYDPHVWLSIHNMEAMTLEILEQLNELYPENKEMYETNAQAYLEKLEVLEEEFNSKLSVCEHDEIIVNHKAFGYLAQEYGFEQVSVTGFSPESEPTPKTIQLVIDEAREHNLTYIFSEGQIDSKVTKTIANDIGGEVLELNPIKLNSDEDYFSIMRNNLDNLAKGLSCSN